MKLELRVVERPVENLEVLREGLRGAMAESLAVAEKETKQRAPVGVGGAPELGHQEGRELDESEPARERFRNLPHQRRGNRPKQQKPPGPSPVSVDARAQAGEERWPGLCLVDYDSAPSTDQRVPAQIQPNALLGLLHVEIGSAQATRQGGLAALPRSEQGNGGVFRQSCAHDPAHQPSSHVLHYRN